MPSGDKARIFTAAEDYLIRQLYENRSNDKAICAGLKLELGIDRSPGTISYRRKVLGLNHRWRNSSEGQIKQHMKRQRIDAINDDIRFKQAMLKAIKSGAESAVPCVVKNKTSTVAKNYTAEPSYSISSSSAGW